jgi:hypothetical protein
LFYGATWRLHTAKHFVEGYAKVIIFSAPNGSSIVHRTPLEQCSQNLLHIANPTLWREMPLRLTLLKPFFFALMQRKKQTCLLSPNPYLNFLSH